MFLSTQDPFICLVSLFCIPPLLSFFSIIPSYLSNPSSTFFPFPKTREKNAVIVVHVSFDTHSLCLSVSLLYIPLLPSFFFIISSYWFNPSPTSSPPQDQRKGCNDNRSKWFFRHPLKHPPRSGSWFSLVLSRFLSAFLIKFCTSVASSLGGMFGFFFYYSYFLQQ